jgi:alpha-tubulin suppressor-like RCC1 family protein
LRFHRHLNVKPKEIEGYGSCPSQKWFCVAKFITCLTQLEFSDEILSSATEDGKVLTWGHGRHGQLGHGDLNSAKVPTLVKALECHRVVFVACGSSWTAAVTGISLSIHGPCLISV